MAEKTTPKSESIRALAHLREFLDGELTPIQRAQARGLADYAIEQVELIQETTRKRRPTIPVRLEADDVVIQTGPLGEKGEG